MVEDADIDVVFDILGNGSARRVLEFTSAEPLTAYELAEECEASLPTIYRQLRALTKHGLLEASIRFDDEGNRHTEYEANLEVLAIRLENGNLDVAFQRQQMADDFETFWREFDQS